jgi:pentose-5-phosphate-3-epimerase
VKARGLDVEIEVDGNVSWDNIPRMVQAGAQVLVAGSSSLFDGEGSLRENLRRMRSIAGGA